MEHTLRVASAHQSAESRHALHIAVAQLGHSVCVHAGTGQELIDAAQKPDLVIVQESLPDMTGLEAVRQACGPAPVPITLVIDRNDGQLLDQPSAENVLAVLKEAVDDDG